MLARDARELGGQLFPQGRERGIVGGGLEIWFTTGVFPWPDGARHQAADLCLRRRPGPGLEARG